MKSCGITKTLKFIYFLFLITFIGIAASNSRIVMADEEVLPEVQILSHDDYELFLSTYSFRLVI